MKNIFLILILFAAFTVNAQRVRQLTDVQVDEVETLNSGTITLSGGPSTLSVDILVTQDGGTTDGSIQVEARNGSGGNWLKLGEYQSSEFLTITGTGTGLQDSVITLDDAEVYHYVFNPCPFREVRFNVTGTASDTTTVSFDYLINYYK